jgi:predicted membrane-bound spermidine synthase
VRLGAVVFLAGAATLSVEICASRLLAPFFGSSTVVWANVIGLILVYLSVGYWFGGKLADRRPQAALLGRIILVAALAIAVIPFIARPFLDATVQELDTASLGAAVGSFFAALALFAVPVTLLGTVSPFAIRLSLPTVENAGSVSGRLYALSTIGSILGTFVAAIVAIQFVGTQRTMIGTAVLLAVAAGLLLGPRWQLLAVAFAALLALPPGAIKSGDGLLYEAESRYQYVDVRQQSDGARALELNEGVVANSLWYPGHVLTGGEWDMFTVVPPLVSHPARRVLILGNAGGSTARALTALYPHLAVDGVEIDPAVTAAARRYLGLARIPRLHVITADARAYLRSTKKRYDVIAIDVYRQPYIPFQVTTREFFSEVRSHLTPGGCVALNVARFPKDRGLLNAIAATVRSELDQSWDWDALKFNSLLFACRGPLSRAELVRRAGDVAPQAQSLVPLFRRGVYATGFHGTVLTDDRAPVEWLSDRAIVSYVAHGGRLQDDYLPTRP